MIGNNITCHVFILFESNFNTQYWCLCVWEVGGVCDFFRWSKIPVVTKTRAWSESKTIILKILQIKKKYRFIYLFIFMEGWVVTYHRWIMIKKILLLLSYLFIFVEGSVYVSSVHNDKENIIIILFIYFCGRVSCYVSSVHNSKCADKKNARKKNVVEWIFFLDSELQK